MVSLSVLSLRPHLLQVLYVLWGVTMTTLQVSPWRRLVRSVASNTTCCFLMNCLALLISLHIRSMWETSVMHKQVSGWTVNFGPNFPESPFLELKTRKPLPPISENFRFGMTKVYSGIPPPFRKTSDLGWPKFTPEYLLPPPFRKTLDLGWPKFTLEYPPPFRKTSHLGWPKFTPEYPPPFRKTSDLGWPKFTPEYPPISENFRFGMTKVYSGIPPPISENFRFGMTKVYSGIPPAPPILENFRFGMTKVYSGIPPPISENFTFGMTKVYSRIPPPPPFRKTSDLGWPKFTPEYPPISENFRFGMTKVYSGIPPPHFGKLQIWDDQSLLRNNPPHFGKLQIWDDQSLLRNNPPHFRKLQIWDDQSLLRNTPPPRENCQRVQVRDFLNTEIYYMWRLYPTRITTSWWGESEEKKPARSRERRLQDHVVSASLRYSHVLFSFICISGRTMRKPDYFVRSKLYFIFFQLQVPGPPFQFLCFEALKYGYLTWLFHIFSKYNFLWYTITFSYFKQFLILLCSAYLSFS